MVSAKASYWIVSPLVDLLFVCGGALVLLTALHCLAVVTAANHQVQYFADLAVLLSLLLAETHTLSTAFATDGEVVRPQFSHYKKLAAFTSIFLVILVCTLAWMAPYVVRLYLLSVSWHFISQTRGIIFIYLRKANFELTIFQEYLWSGLLRLSMCNWILVQLSSYFGDRPESFLHQSLTVIHIVPKPCVNVVNAIIVVASVVAVLNIVFLKYKSKPLPPPPAIFLLVLAVLLFFPANPVARLQPSLWLFAPALFHGSQYLCVVAARIFAAIHCLEESAKLTFLLKRYGQCLLFSVVIFLFLPWLIAALGRPFGLKYAVAVAAVFVGMQVYHMAIDSVIWRRRESHV